MKAKLVSFGIFLLTLLLFSLFLFGMISVYPVLSGSKKVEANKSDVAIDSTKDIKQAGILMLLTADGRLKNAFFINLSDDVSIAANNPHEQSNSESLFNAYAKSGAVGSVELFNKSSKIKAQRYIAVDYKNAARFFGCFGSFELNIKSPAEIPWMDTVRTVPAGRQRLSGEVTAELIFSDDDKISCDIFNQAIQSIMAENDAAERISKSLSYAVTDITAADIMVNGQLFNSDAVQNSIDSR